MFGFPIEVQGGKFIEIGHSTILGKDCRIEALSDYYGQRFSPKIVIGNSAVINPLCHIGCINEVNIGNYVTIGERSLIIDHTHGDSSYDEGVLITQTVSGSEANSDATTATYYVPATLKTIVINYAGQDGYVVPEKTFSGFDSALKTVTLNGNVTEIADGAFMGSSIQSIVIPDSVTKIGAYAFASCPMLKDVTLSANVASIGEKAFYQFKGTEIAFPEVSENVLVIGTLAFAESKLTTIVGYEYVKETGKWAFYNSEDLVAPYVNAGADKFGNAFDGCIIPE